MNQTPSPAIEGSGSLLVVDQGSHASKAIVYAGDGRPAAEAEVPVATAHPAPGWAEHDAESLLASVDAAIRQVCAGLTRNLRPAVAGLATQRSTLVCWHAGTGQPLSPAISWQDRRNAGWLEDLELDPEQVREITGLVPTPHYGASKFRWCLDHLPDVAAARRDGQLRMGPLSSFLTARLANVPGPGRGAGSVDAPVVDPANASRTLLWDVGRRDWSDSLLARFGLTRELLPRCVASRYDHGTLATPDGPVPLAVCTGDQPATLFASGRPDPDAIYVNLGTGAFLQRLAGSEPTPGGMLRSVCWQDGERVMQVHEGTVNGAGAALSWLARREATREQALFDGAPAWLAREKDPPLFVNGVGGLGAPFWIPDCRVGFDRTASLPARTVAIIESIVFLLQANIDALGTAGTPPARIVVSGGLARLDGLCQRLADLSGLRVERLGDVEATALGVAWLLRHDPGSPGGSLDATPRAEPATRFEPGANPGLAARYRKWRTLLSDRVAGPAGR